MAALLRISPHPRLSLITDGLSRLRLQHTGPSNVSRHATHPRTFSQTRSTLLKKPLTTSITTATLDHDPSSSKRSTDKNNCNNNNNAANPPILSQLPIPAQTSPTARKIRTCRKDRVLSRWTDEEDKELLRLAKEGKESFDVFANHFRHRSYRTVANRMTFALIADRILQQHAEGKTQGLDGEEKAIVDAVLAAGGESAPLRTLYLAIKLAKAKQRAADKSDDSVLRSRITRTFALRKKEWTPEDDELLKRLVHKHIDTPEPSIWHKVSGGTIDGSILLRTVTACMRRWRALYPQPLARAGRWSAEEELRLQKAISEQLEGKYQVLVDVLVGVQSAQAKEKRLRLLEKKHLRQLPSQSSLPILKPGSRRLRMLNWVTIADQVQSRNFFDCREHFYVVYHNGNMGPWSEDELKRLKEGVELFGKDLRSVTEHIGTRSVHQVSRLQSGLRYKEKTRLKAAEKKQKAHEAKQLQQQE